MRWHPDVSIYIYRSIDDILCLFQAGWTCLMIAASIGHDTLLELYLDAGADVHKRNDTGQTALHYAASRNRQEVSL